MYQYIWVAFYAVRELNDVRPASERRCGKALEIPSAHSPADGGPDHGNLPPGPALAAGTGRLDAVFLAPVSYVLVLTPTIPDSPRDSLHGTAHCRFHPHFTRHLSGTRRLSSGPCERWYSGSQHFSSGSTRRRRKRCGMRTISWNSWSRETRSLPGHLLAAVQPRARAPRGDRRDGRDGAMNKETHSNSRMGRLKRPRRRNRVRRGCRRRRGFRWKR